MIEQGEGLGPALERLYSRRAFGVKPGLDGIQALCAELGRPEQSFASIHIAGTNGKGSVAALVEAVLRHCGLHPGLYTSPHLVHFNERIRIDGVDATNADLAASLDICERAAAQIQSTSGYELTFFEIATAMAFVCMRDAEVRLAVIETGLGGRLDATNVVHPLVSVITRIGMDHEQYLGSGLADIAYEKAGIIKSGRPIISAAQAPEAEAVLRRRAAEQESTLIFAPDVVSVERVGKPLPAGQKVRIATQRGLSGQMLLPLVGNHQIENLGVAIAALEIAADAIGVSIDAEVLRGGLSLVRWPGRMQYLKPNVLLDAAHNADGAKALVQSLRGQGWRKVILVTGMCADKDIAGVVRVFADIAVAVYCCALPGDRSLDPDILADSYRQYGVSTTVIADPASAVQAAEVAAKERDLPVVIAGSIFLAGAVLSV